MCHADNEKSENDTMEEIEQLNEKHDKYLGIVEADTIRQT